MKNYLLASLAGLFATGLSAQNVVCLDIEPNPNTSDAALAPFTKYINVFGIGVYAESTISDEKVKHVAAIFAEWLDNDEDGTVDDPNVLAELTSRNALMPVFSQEGSAAENTFFTNYTGNGVGAVCYNGEIIPSRPLTTQFDATLEENLHTISSLGYANAYPAVFGEGESSNSPLTQAMDLARGGHFTTIPSPYPAGSWYHYDDATCNYECMVTEYFYWGLTSMLGIQDYGTRCAEIANEWEACTAAQFQSMDTMLYNIFNNTSAGYVIPTNVPDGNYCPAGASLEESSPVGEVKLYPNPSTGSFTVELEKAHYGELRLTDGTGKLIKVIEMSGNTENINLSVDNGMYFIQLGNQVVGRVVVQQ